MGAFYQWNRKVSWSATDPMINSDGGNMWDRSHAEGDTWEAVNDPCPPGWRVPTFSEFESLENAGSQWTTINGVNGRIFGSNNLLFLPAAGSRYYDNGMRSGVGTYGVYWSSSVIEGSAFNFSFGDTGIGFGTSNHRALGLSIRCVAE